MEDAVTNDPDASRPLILVVDDDPNLRDVIRYALEAADFAVAEATDGLDGLLQIERQKPDLVVLDVLMPEMDGLTMCRELRKHSAVPVLFLSSRDEEVDKVIGLELGGDDYLPKNFSPRELVAGVRAILRRSKMREETLSPGLLRCGRLELDEEAREIRVDGAPAPLTGTEFTLIAALLRNPRRAFSRDALMDAVYDGETVVSPRTLDSHVRGVRARFAALGLDTVVETLHGFGYKLGSCQ